MKMDTGIHNIETWLMCTVIPGTDGMLTSVLQSHEAQEARQALETAISFFERVKGPASAPNDVNMEMDDVRPLVHSHL